MIRLAIVIALISAEGVTALEIAHTSEAIAAAEPRDVPVVVDWLAFGAMAKDDDGIHFQPLLCAMMGRRVSRFVKWHEAGHYRDRSGSQRMKEDAADVYAARHADRLDTLETIAWLRRENAPGTENHRSDAQRADLIERALERRERKG